MKDMNNLIRAIVYSNPQSNLHVLYKKDDVVYIYYGNANELLYIEECDITPGIYIYSNDMLISSNKIDKVGEIYVMIVDVIETDLLK